MGLYRIRSRNGSFLQIKTQIVPWDNKWIFTITPCTTKWNGPEIHVFCIGEVGGPLQPPKLKIDKNEHLNYRSWYMFDHQLFEKNRFLSFFHSFFKLYIRSTPYFVRFGAKNTNFNILAKKNFKKMVLKRGKHFWVFSWFFAP